MFEDAVSLSQESWLMWLGLVALFLAAGVLLALGYLDTRKEEVKTTVAERMAKLAESQLDTSPKPSAKMTRAKQLQQPLLQRLLIPVAQSAYDLLKGLLPLGAQSWTQRQLVQAGYNQPKHAKLFLGTQLLLVSVLGGFFFAFTLFFGAIDTSISLLITGVLALVGYAFPLGWLQGEAKKRQKAIQQGLADFLDLLVICVEAGLGLDVAMQKIADLPGNTTSPQLRAELKRYGRDLSLGKPRKESLSDLAMRTGLEDFSTLINALIQAYDMGSGITHTLRVQSETLRNKRIMRAEEMANKIPVKMVIPIYVFLFPAIFVSMFGPMGMILVETMSSITGNTGLGQ
jgi:tight adherence protein C